MSKAMPAVHELQESLAGPRAVINGGAPVRLESGAMLGPVTVAYQTWGELNADRSNVVLVCHALTGDQYAVGTHPITGKPGWWESMIGPGKSIDTDRFFVICPNCLGGCMGTTGPAATNPGTGEPYGIAFPVITIRDMVQTQAMLLDTLGIDKVMCVIGGSMGAMQVLDWAACFPQRVVSAVAIAGAARHSAQNIAFHEVGRQAIMADPDWCGGYYFREGKRPDGTPIQVMPFESLGQLSDVDAQALYLFLTAPGGSAKAGGAGIGAAPGSGDVGRGGWGCCCDSVS